MSAAESVALATGSVGLQLGIRACFTTIRPLVILGVFLKIVLVNMKAEHSGPLELGVPPSPPKILAEVKTKDFLLARPYIQSPLGPPGCLDLPTVLIQRERKVGQGLVGQKLVLHRKNALRHLPSGPEEHFQIKWGQVGCSLPPLI